MSTLSEKLIEALKNEEDEAILNQVLNFYEYLKYKKENNNSL